MLADATIVNPGTGFVTLDTYYGGSITQTGGSITANHLRVQAISDVTLNSTGNAISNLMSYVSGGDLSVYSTTGVHIGDVNTLGVTVSGNFNLTANGAITQTDLISVGGSASFDTTGALAVAGGSVDLAGTGGAGFLSLDSATSVAGHLNLTAATANIMNISGIGASVAGNAVIVAPTKVGAAALRVAGTSNALNSVTSITASGAGPDFDLAPFISGKSSATVTVSLTRNGYALTSGLLNTSGTVINLDRHGKPLTFDNQNLGFGEHA